MRTIVLSDHAADQLRHREAERERQYTLALKAYTERLEARQARIDTLSLERTQAWKERGYLRALWHTLAMVWARHCKRRDEKRRPLMASPGTEDLIWEHGRAGEQRVEDYLAGRLNDEWICVSGYRNRKGEIDKILAGPLGIYAIEIKNHNGIISCHGDTWTRDKYDQWGNLVRADEIIADRGGRSPSKQVNEPADLLEAFLARTLPGCRIRRCVAFANDDVSFGEMRGLSVDSVLLRQGWDLGEMVEERMLSPKDVDRTVELIVRDHMHYQTRRALRRAPAAPELLPET